MFHTLPVLKNEARTARKDVPYIYEYYNISCFTPNLQTLLHNTLARMVNCLVKAYNDATTLPRLILMIPDWDIIRFVHKYIKSENIYEDAEIELAIKKALQLLVNQLDRATDTEKDNMVRKKPGLVVSHQPRFIWLKMINRVNGNGKGNILSFRPVFNADLENILSDRTTDHLIADLSQAMMDASLFDRHNNLNAFGRVKFWEELDKLLEKYDKRAVHLKPSGKVTHQEFMGQVSQARRRQNRARRFFATSRHGSIRGWRNVFVNNNKKYF